MLDALVLNAIAVHNKNADPIQVIDKQRFLMTVSPNPQITERYRTSFGQYIHAHSIGQGTFSGEKLEKMKPWVSF